MDSSSDLEDPSQALLAEEDSPEEVDTNEEDEEAQAAEDEDEDAFIRLSRYTQSPEAVPWEQRSTKMKVVYIADRAFLSFLALFIVVLSAEILYKVAYLVHWQVIYKVLVNWMVTQEEDEELLEL